MRFVWAVVAFVLAAALIGAGIAQRTIFMGPDSVQEKVQIEEPAPFILLDGDVLRAHPGAQTLLISGDGDIFSAYGRTADMEAWLADSDYNQVTVDDDGSFQVEHIAAPAAEDDAVDSGDAATEEPTAEDDPAADSGRNPVGSDLWLNSFSDTDSLSLDNLRLPEGVSVLVAYDGTENAPDDIVASWPLDTSTPAAGPLMAGGGVLLLVGLILYVLGIRHQRRGRGPRRKGPGPLPVTEPIDLASLPAGERAAIESGATPAKPQATDDDVQDAEIVDEPAAPADEKTGGKTDEKTEGKSTMKAADPARRRRRLLVVPILGLTAVLAAGCSSDSWPQLGAPEATPSPTPTVIAPENQKPPAVTEGQAERILGEISTTLVEADTNRDLDLAKTRLDGPALTARTTDYALRTAIADSPVPAAIPTDDVEVVLPEATDRWPRTTLLLSKSADDETVPPVLLTMTQQDPWSNYKVTNIAEMSADAVFPDVAAAWLGTALVPDDSAFLSIAPGELAAAFADVVDTGEKSASNGLFDDLSQKLATSIRDSRQTVVQNLIDNGAAETSEVSFDMAPTDTPAVSMTTLDSGAIVGITLTDAETVKPTSADAVIRFGDNAKANALTGVSESAKGVVTTYEFQLFFSVPAQGSTEQIKLLASRQDLVSVEVIK
ncbi:glycosyl transferase [Microbacterium sp. kSW2-24]|uniref:glycosyl transferase n=1 Tax=Microbacterium galbinum TaxID=2851646 RepID=UPI001FFD0DFD|nr:glycosyl transferase [Microbacterium galbinum]MCK2021873.1 glycosyl transferase [Microbacterium galbinum]